jgi:hypothetical protein
VKLTARIVEPCLLSCTYFHVANRLLATVTLFLAHVISFTLKMEVHVPPKRRFIINPHGAVSQKTAFF